MAPPSISAAVTTFAVGLGWGEGPAVLPGASGVVLSDVTADAIYLWQLGATGIGEFCRPSQHANGNAVDAAGRLVTCEHRTRCVTRTEAEGSMTVLADAYDGRRLNSPNDVVVTGDGAVWFTDPPYGLSAANVVRMHGWSSQGAASTVSTRRPVPSCG